MGLATSIPLTNLRQYINSNLVFNDLKLRLLNPNSDLGRYIQPTIAHLGFSDHLVAIHGENPLDLATPLGLATSTPVTEAGRKTQCRLYFARKVYFKG